MPDTPANELRAAAERLLELATPATPGPWRAHDTHLDLGGHTATVLSGERNETQLLAWLPTMSHESWDETRNAWRNADFIAAMHPGVALALADWLESTARTVDAVADKYTPDPAAHWLAPALAVARQILGTEA